MYDDLTIGPEATNLRITFCENITDQMLKCLIIANNRLPEANLFLSILAPILKLLRGDVFDHLEVVWRGLQVLSEREDIHAHRLRPKEHVGHMICRRIIIQP